MVAIVMGSKKSKFNDPKTLVFRNQPGGRLNLSNQVVIDSHRSGWRFALEGLKDIHHVEGVQFDGFIERAFGWHLSNSVFRGKIPYTHPWVGVMHNPPNMPDFWNRAASPQGIIGNYYFKESLRNCLGFFVLSEYHANWLRGHVQVPVVSLKHPTALDVPQFSLKKFLRKKKKSIVQLGFWLRKFQSLKHLPLDGFVKTCIIPHKYAAKYRNLERRYIDIHNEFGEEAVGKYREKRWLSAERYDKVLQRSIVFLDLYDASANNAILECIARSTPVLVNPLPAVIEYLGEGYPFYFSSLEEAAAKAGNADCVRDAHEYLSNIDKHKFSVECFKSELVGSCIYQDLPLPRTGHILDADLKPQIDTFDDIRVIRGTPLTTKFVFVVCFRNLTDKLERCIQSISRQHKNYDYGVILIDDASALSSIDIAIKILNEKGVPNIVVKNASRKYFTRNLYNAVNLLINNDDSIVIEVDGDDYLENTDVLGILNDAYDMGAIKTFGSFRCVPRKSNAARAIEGYKLLESFSDMTRPWDLDVCVSWMHLKSYKKSLFMKVPLVYFWEKQGHDWLKMGEDIVIHPKMIEISQHRTAFIEDILYVYDVTGQSHDSKKIEQAEYLINKLYRTPFGSFINECRQKLRKQQKLSKLSDLPQNKVSQRG